MTRFALLLPLLLAGCYEDTCDPGCCVDPSDSVDNGTLSHLRSTLTLDPALTDVERSAVISAADAWRQATDLQVEISFVLGERALGHAAVVRAPPGLLKPGMLASTTDSVIAIGEALEGSGYLRAGLVHEFGHYLGLGHEPDLPDDIMYPCTHEDMPTTPTPDAVHDLRVLYDLP